MTLRKSQVVLPFVHGHGCSSLLLMSVPALPARRQASPPSAVRPSLRFSAETLRRLQGRQKGGPAAILRAHAGRPNRGSSSLPAIWRWCRYVMSSYFWIASECLPPRSTTWVRSGCDETLTSLSWGRLFRLLLVSAPLLSFISVLRLARRYLSAPPACSLMMTPWGRR